MTAKQWERERMIAILRELSRLAPSNEGLGGHADLGAFIDVAQRARVILRNLPEFCPVNP